MLGAISAHQQGHRRWGKRLLVAVEHEAAQRLTQRRRSRFTGHNDGEALVLQALLQAPYLRRLAGTLRTLERDEAAARRLRGQPAQVHGVHDSHPSVAPPHAAAPIGRPVACLRHSEDERERGAVARKPGSHSR